MESSSRVEEAVARLRKAGERLTPGRRAVLEVLDADGAHLDAEDVAARVSRRVPGVHRATVYRSLQALVDTGLVSHTHVPGAATIYHLALHRHSDGPEEVYHSHGHAHLQCVVCERFIDVDASEFDVLAARVKALTGFVVDPAHAALLGTCADCGEHAPGTP